MPRCRAVMSRRCAVLPIPVSTHCYFNPQGPNWVRAEPKAPCSPSPCQNGGQCMRRGTNGYECRCSSPVHVGQHCERELPHCYAASIFVVQPVDSPSERCTVFYQHDPLTGNGGTLTCPGNLKFNTNICVCDWPYNVDQSRCPLKSEI